jgi:hypothetical protein
MTTKQNAEATAAEEAVEQKFLSKQVGEQTDSVEARNIYGYQMSSTETANISPEDFHKLKLTS